MVSLWMVIQADVLSTANKDEMSSLNNVYIPWFYALNNLSWFLSGSPPQRNKKNPPTNFWIKKWRLFTSVAIKPNLD